MNLVDGERPPARVARGFQAAGYASFEISYCGSPRSSVHVSATCPGRREARELVDMAAGLVEIDALPQPDHGGHAEIALQHALDVGARDRPVAIRIEQALLGGQARALAVHVNRPAFQHEGGSIALRTLDLQHFLCDLVIAVPRKVQTPVQAAPRVEGPIDAAAPALGVDDESRPAVPDPGIVAAEFDAREPAVAGGPAHFETARRIHRP